jgi:hypothetical protein
MRHPDCPIVPRTREWDSGTPKKLRKSRLFCADLLSHTQSPQDRRKQRPQRHGSPRPPQSAFHVPANIIQIPRAGQ